MIRRTFLKIAMSVIGGAAIDGLPASGSAKPTDRPNPVAGKRPRKKDGLVIGVLSDPLLAAFATPSQLKIADFQQTWGAMPNVRVVALDRYQIRSYATLFEGQLDVLVYPYGPAYPMDAAPFYTGDSVLGFLKRGGAILTTGGVPFGNPLDENGRPISGHAPGEEATPTAEVYARWVAPLGYKYYQHPVTPPVLKADRAFLPSIPADTQLPGSPIGIVANNSSHEPVPQPYHGNVFPERYPARQVTPLLLGTDRYGQTLATNALLIQDFEDGSRRIHFSHMGDQHPLAHGTPLFANLMGDVLALLANRLVVKDVQTGYACYRDGEPVIVRAELISFDDAEPAAEVLVEIRDGDTVVDTHHENISIPSGKSAFLEWTWNPGHFGSDDYTVSVSILRDGRTVSRGNNGFVVWKEEVARAGPGVEINGKYFRRSDGESFVLGTNYYESTRGEIMWFRPDVSRISADLRSMRDCGVSYIRPHYHHLKWFKDYLLFQHQRLLPYFESLEKVTDPLPDEHAWRIFDAFIYLCQKLGIAYGGDLFTLVPAEMGDPRGWFPLTDAVVIPEKRVVAKRFFQQINERYKNVPCILWDLWNEPSVPVPPLKDWIGEMRTCLADLPIRRLITVGGGMTEQLGDSIDFFGLHVGIGDIRNHVNPAPKPLLAQETYMDHLEDLASEEQQAGDMRNGILSSVYAGFAGFAPWSWTRQMRLWQDSYEHDPQFRMETWDDRLGAQTHDDGTIKPAGRVFKDFANLLRSISFTAFDSATKTVHTSRGRVTVTFKDAGGMDALMHHDDDHCFAAMGTGAISWKGNPLLQGSANASFYIFCPQDDLLSAKKLFFKCDQPGSLRLVRSSAPLSLSLVDLTPHGVRLLETLPHGYDGQALTLTVAPTQEAYWIAAEW
jgi:hypothetical protein